MAAPQTHVCVLLLLLWELLIPSRGALTFWCVCLDSYIYEYVNEYMNAKRGMCRKRREFVTKGVAYNAIAVRSDGSSIFVAGSDQRIKVGMIVLTTGMSHEY